MPSHLIFLLGLIRRPRVRASVRPAVLTLARILTLALDRAICANGAGACAAAEQPLRSEHESQHHPSRGGLAVGLSGGAAYAQQTCVDPTTQQPDVAATTAWLNDVAKANNELMNPPGGTWVGPPELGDARSLLTGAYDADGTLTFVLHQCGGQPNDPCMDFEGTGAWAAYPETERTFYYGRILVAPGVLAGLCQSEVVTDANTVTTLEGLVITRMLKSGL